MVILSKGSFRKQLRQKNNYQSNAPTNFESILIGNGIYDLSNYKYVSKDYESIKIMNLTNNKCCYIRY